MCFFSSDIILFPFNITLATTAQSATGIVTVLAAWDSDIVYVLQLKHFKLGSSLTFADVTEPLLVSCG